MYTPLKEATHQAIWCCKEQECNLLKKKISNYGRAIALVAAFRSVYGSFQMATNIHTRRLTAKTSGSEIRTKALGQSLPDPSGEEYLCRGGKPRCSMHNECGASWEEVDRTWGARMKNGFAGILGISSLPSSSILTDIGNEMVIHGRRRRKRRT